MNYFSSDFRLGILGGGQLGKMLLTDTRKFDIQTFVLDPSEEAPARFGCNAFYKGSLLDYETVYRWLHHSVTADKNLHQRIQNALQKMATRMPEPVLAKEKKPL